MSVRVPPHGLEGHLVVPSSARGLVVFAHGSGSSRHSSRNQFVARRLQEAGLGTLLMDLLTVEEERAEAQTAHLRFDIGLLAERLTSAVDWISAREDVGGLPIGLFGASTGAGAALVTAAARPTLVSAVVSRGGRPDLAGEALRQVQSPTLLVVGGDDQTVLELNRQAAVALVGRWELEVVPGAGHLFEEPGALDRVAELAGAWFQRWLV